MKSQLSSMLEIWEAASFDATSACATSLLEAERDFSRLKEATHARGLTTFVIDLPSLDPLLTSLLENERVHFEGPFTGRRSKTDARPKFLWQFWSLVCDSQGYLLTTPNPDAIAAIRQLSCFFKKYEVQCSPARVKNAVDEFYAIEAKLTPPNLDWCGDHLGSNAGNSFARSFEAVDLPLLGHSDSPSDPGFLRRLDQVSRILVSELGTFDSMSDASLETGYFKHGPGAVSNLKGKGYKYSFPAWSEKLEGLFPFDWCSGAPLGSSPLSRVESPSALLAVPKTAKTPRLIASEPVEHQFCQQKLYTWMDYRFSKSIIGQFVDLHNQELSQLLVAKASRDRSLATLDLSSASDRVTCRHIECLFDANRTVLDALHATRTRWIEDRVSKSNDNVILKKFASMGSAMTFPIQCVFFLAVALASAGAWHPKSIRNLRGQVRVFGDDIIIPNHAYAACVTNLHYLGLKVNVAKSFSHGHFRESCGADYWCGFDVTPVKPKSLCADTPVGVQALIDLSNNLYLKGWWKASNRVLKMIPSRLRRNVFLSSDGVPGVISHSSRKLAPLKWDHHLHRYYVPHVVVVKHNERVRQDNSFALREFFSRPFMELNPRETGTKRMGAAAYAASRVELTL